MRLQVRTASVAFLATLLISGLAIAGSHTRGMKEGKPDLKSAGPLAFGPKGILFIADPRGAAIFALDTGDADRQDSPAPLKVEGVDQKIAALLGTAPGDIEINDLAVNPVSGKAYLSVSRGRGNDSRPALIRVGDGSKLELLKLDKVKFSRAAIPDAPAADAEQRRGKRVRKLRQESITDLAFVDGRILVAGLSNEEFSSTLRSIPFPFKNIEKGATVEIYHGAHGKFETHSPVRTFVPYEIDGEMSVLAAYTCTPLVELRVSELKSGAHVKGRTIAELGNRNRPLDMIVYEDDGEDFLLLANNKRGIMKISTAEISKAKGITEKVLPRGSSSGQPYETISDWKNVHQLDRLGANHAVVVRATEGSSFILETLELP